jgi:hypothetical protein
VANSNILPCTLGDKCAFARACHAYDKKEFVGGIGFSDTSEGRKPPGLVGQFLGCEPHFKNQCSSSRTRVCCRIPHRVKGWKDVSCAESQSTIPRDALGVVLL